MNRMASYYVEAQDFGWEINDADRYDENGIRLAPRPRIALINTYSKWYEFDRTDMDAVIYWTSEGLGNERTDGYPIVPLGSNDMVFSSSLGPNSTINLNFWFQYFLDACSLFRVRKLFPNPEIVENKLFCSLGNGRLPRCYAWCRLLDEDLVEENLISFVSEQYYWSTQMDVTNELSGQAEMSKRVRREWSKIPTSPLRFSDDWRWSKLQNSWYGMTRSGFHASLIIPTKVVNKSSLLLVLETLLHDKEFFLTEKTIKALVSGRPSIIVGCINNLDMIKDLGFLTWDGLIDENYQKLIGPKSRIDAAISESRRFIDWNILNHPSALREAERIAQHNLQHLFSYDWSANIRLALDTARKRIGIG